MPSFINEGFSTSGPATANPTFTAELDTIKRNKTPLDNYINSGLDSDINAASNTFLSYVASRGSNTNMYDALQPIRDKLSNYNTVVSQPLSALRQRVLAALNVNTQSAALTQKYEDLENLKKELSELDTDASTAYVRETALDTREDAVSFRQTWGYMNRPLRRNSIAILIVFAIIFAGAATYGLYYMNSGVDDIGVPIKAIAASAASIIIGIVVVLKLMKLV